MIDILSIQNTAYEKLLDGLIMKKKTQCCLLFV